MSTAPRIGRAVAAAAVGNAFEWYDFTVFVLFAPFIADAFFPGGETAGLIKTFLTFGIGFVARPVGGALIGYFGDRSGRKAALTLTFALMAAGTLVIAVAPTHAAIGGWGPALVLGGRLLQGLSAGGEIGGAAAFLVEHAPPGRRARFTAVLQATMAVSNILGALVALAVRALIPAAAMADWGWRVPFLFGLLIVPIGLWLRATLEETPEFTAQAQAQAHHAPILAVLKTQGAGVARGFGLSILWGVCTYSLVIFMPVHAQKTLGFSPDEAFVASLTGNVVLVGTCFLSGWLADRIGRLRLLERAAWALLVVPPLLMALLAAEHALIVLVLAQIGFCILAGLYAGAMPATLAELFPTRVRSTATSIAYNAAFSPFAGFAPVVITWLAAGGTGAQAPTLYVAAAAAIALITIRSFPAAARAEAMAGA